MRPRSAPPVVVVAAAAALCLAAPPAARAGQPAPAAAERVLVLERTATTWSAPGPTEPAAPGKGAAEEPEPAAAEETGPKKLSERRFTVWLAPGRLREKSHGDGTVTIILLEEGLVWLIDPDKKTYREMSLEKVRSRTRQARARLARRVPLVEDAAGRSRLEKLLGIGPEPAEVKVEYPGGTRTVAGRECREVVVGLDGEELFRGWLAAAPAALADERWLLLGGCFPEGVAAGLGGVKGLLMEASFPLAGGGRLQLTTGSAVEKQLDPADFQHPEKSGYEPLDRTRDGKRR
jgi:hypothetical protein